MVMSIEEICAIDWNTIEHDALIALCRNWHGEGELFRRIIQRSLQLVYLDMNELAGEIGNDVHEIQQWLDGGHYPCSGWTVLILDDLIQVRLQTYRKRMQALA